jgi:hypothetical protein
VVRKVQLPLLQNVNLDALEQGDTRKGSIKAVDLIDFR